MPRLAILMILAVVGSGPAGSDDKLRTRAELTDFQETSHADDVQRVLEALTAASPTVRVTHFGTSEEGRRLPLAIVAPVTIRDAASARRSGLPRVLVMADIHAGEVEGKEAALVLVRRLAIGDLRSLSSRLVVLFAPLYNVDGNERISLDHRPEQFGPLGGVGTRENAKGLDLNRDFTKLEAAESRALVKLMTEWDPHVVIDLHTTNGSYHGYHLTYAPTLAVGADSRIVEFERTMLLAPVMRVLGTQGWRSHGYGNFVTVNQLSREQERPPAAGEGDRLAWRTFDARPRFVTNGVGLRNRISILSEAYSYLSFERRIAVTEAFVETLLREIAHRAQEVMRLEETVDRETSAAGARGTLGPLGTSGMLRPGDSPVPILVGDVEARVNPRSGREMIVMKESVAVEQPMLEYDRFDPVDAVRAPVSYAIPSDGSLLVERVASLLALHGIRADRVAAARTMSVEAVVAVRLVRSDRTFQGHLEARLAEIRRDARKLTLPPGSLIVPMGQPLARLAFHLLEPTSDDGLVTWNFLDDWLAEGRDVPVYRVLAN